MKRIISTILAVTIFIVISGCSEYKAKEYVEDISFETEHITFEEAINSSYVIVSAKLIEKNSDNSIRTYTFTVNNVIKNEMLIQEFTVISTDADISVSQDGKILYDYSTTQNPYELGESYILVLERKDSVYDGEVFLIVADIYVPLEGENINEIRQYNQPIDNNVFTISDWVTYVNNVIDKDSDTYNSLNSTIEYVDSNDINEILNGSKYVVRVRINEMYVEGRTNRDTYNCTVLHEFTGEIDNFKGNSNSKEILIPFFKGTIEPGSEYIIMLNDTDANSLIYSLSSANSVYLPTDNAVLDLLS